MKRFDTWHELCEQFNNGDNRLPNQPNEGIHEYNVNNRQKIIVKTVSHIKNDGTIYGDYPYTHILY